MRILFASTNLPYPPTSGGAQRTALILRSLQELAEVDCIFLQPQIPSPDRLADLAQRCRIKLIVSTRQILEEENSRIFRRLLPGKAGQDMEAFFNAGRFRWHPHIPSVKKLGDLGGYDLIVARYLQTAITFDLFGKRPLLLDVDDYDPDRLRLRLQSARWWDRLTVRRCLRYSEKAHARYLPRATYCWIANPHDRRHPVLSEAHVLPNIPYSLSKDNMPQPLPVNRNSRVFLMVGTMSYSANADGVDAFLKRAWPRVVTEFPGAAFHIAGGGMSDKQKERWGRVPGVKPLGFVADLADAYANCLAAVAPIEAGAGTNIKVLEAAAFGRASVLTAVAHRGLETSLPSGVASLSSTGVDGMAELCLALLREPHRAALLGREARVRVERHHGFPAFKKSIKDGCRNVLESHR